MLRYRLTDEAPVRPRKLRFGFLSAKEIERMSVCQVTETTLYYRGLPASGGLLDPLMGSVDRRHLCASCRRDAKTCQGHSGHMCLSYPVYHIGFIETVLKVLRTTCFFCTKVCATNDDVIATKDIQGRARLTALHNTLRARKHCPHCDMFRPIYQRVPLGIRIEWQNPPWESEEEEEFCTQTFTAREALSILENICDKDVSLLGFDPQISHPKDMIVQNLVVPPPCTRPAIYSSEGSRSRGQNELTVRLLEVLKRSQETKSFMQDKTWEDIQVTPEFMERLNRMQYEVFLLINSNLRIQKPSGMGRSGGSVQIKSLTDRLKGKEGRIRGNLMGKRVDFSARCVITPDAYFDCDCVGVPHKIAMNLTIPETVNASNIHVLAERVRRGANDVRGADTIIDTNGVTTSLRHCKNHKSIILRHGDVVERFLADDDVVVFNRQPSLHMHGMQAHRVKLMPGHTFRLSLPVAAPYNADFDGDEMNLHVPQSRTASAECAALMGVAQNSISSQANKPVMGVVQDSLLGLHLLSQNDIFLDHPHVCRLIGCTRHIDKKLPHAAIVMKNQSGEKKCIWTGKQVFSMLLPHTLFMENHSFDDSDWKDSSMPVTVKRGHLLSGVLRKAHVGTSAGGIIDVLCREFGGVVTLRFMGDVQRMANTFLLQKGHHVGIDDVMLSSEGHRRVGERLAKATKLCEEIQKEVIDAPSEIAQTAERSILRLLSKMLLQSGGIVNEHMSHRNAIRRMVTAGSKGSFINLSQICACLGQQSLEGSRIVAEKGQRTLPYFVNNDISMASRGMVFNSFALGLSPTELFYHAIGGREGLVDTAVKTSQTGYLQRRMNKSMEDHRVHMDGTVRNALQEVVCFRWGSDGLHPSKLERLSVPLLNMSKTRLDQQFTFGEVEMILHLRAAILSTKTHILTTEFDNRLLLPFNPERLKKRLKRSTGPNSSVDPKHVWERLSGLCKRVPMTVALSLVDVFRETNVKDVNHATFTQAFDTVEMLIETASCTEAESVGCLSAQSVGEPATQMTLNTFHLAGCASKNVTLGIPRLKELLDVTRMAKTPCTTLRFHEPYSQSKEFADYMANTLPLTRLGDVVSNTEIVKDPDRRCTVIPADEWIVRVENVMRVEPMDDQHSKYVIRMQLQQQLMKTRQLTPPMIRRMLTERLGERAIVSSSEVNALDWIIRVRFNHVHSMVDTGKLGSDQEAILSHRAANVLMETVIVGGHTSVTSATAAESTIFDSTTACPKNEYVVHTYGKFLGDCVSSHCVDWSRCTSNDIWETYNTLGIEACSHVFFDQLKAVVGFDGTYVDDRHLLIIVDTICKNGFMMPLNRHGINRTDYSPLMRASFEETTDVLCDAAIFAEGENAKGVTTSIMTGQLAEMGTGSVNVMFRSKEVLQNRTHNSLAPKGRALRSTCRSHPSSSGITEVMEYILSDVNPNAPRPLSPPADDENKRKRARFRPVSPTR